MLNCASGRLSRRLSGGIDAKMSKPKRILAVAVSPLPAVVAAVGCVAGFRICAGYAVALSFAARDSWFVFSVGGDLVLSRYDEAVGRPEDWEISATRGRTGFTLMQVPREKKMPWQHWGRFDGSLTNN